MALLHHTAQPGVYRLWQDIKVCRYPGPYQTGEDGVPEEVLQPTTTVRAQPDQLLRLPEEEGVDIGEVPEEWATLHPAKQDVRGREVYRVSLLTDYQQNLAGRILQNPLQGLS